MEQSGTFYERGYSSLHRLLTLLGLTLVGIVVGGLVGILIAKSAGYDLEALTSNLNVSSPLGERNLVRTVALANHLFSFLIPAIIAAYIFYKIEWKEYLRIDNIPALKYLLLGSLFIIVAFPFAQFTYFVNSMIPLPESLMEMESATDGLVKGLLVMDSPVELLFNLLVVALIPAIAEEMIFRGIVQQTLETWLKNPIYAVWAAAAIFSFIHFQFGGFIPRMVLGLVLGYLFYWTRNLWVPILAHFVNNGMQVIAAYFMPEQMDALEPGGMGNAVIVGGVISLGLAMIVARYIIKQRDSERMVF